MIKTFRNRQLEALYVGGRTKIDARLHQRIMLRLGALNVAMRPEDMNLLGFNYHGLQGSPKRYTVHVYAPWCITFGFEGGDAIDVDFERYH
ncbi:plasmid maintenance system killer [Hyphomicrobium sp. xq]|uniref:Plasmid maintenance system killer n=1 Tax=Hyphomicrobium album TaxID=2665159 RepID=A0A6I3KKP6_9HYPH|nr:type II toxin-antitoxin system RelE/ParE family toxin [Hyphomicrobium album]MTD94496.1 plasmid maintenance system killer [Hyphomicrobium album]